MASKRGSSLKNDANLLPNRMQLRPRDLKNERKAGNFSKPSQPLQRPSAIAISADSSICEAPPVGKQHYEAPKGVRASKRIKEKAATDPKCALTTERNRSTLPSVEFEKELYAKNPFELDQRSPTDDPPVEEQKSQTNPFLRNSSCQSDKVQTEVSPEMNAEESLLQ